MSLIEPTALLRAEGRYAVGRGPLPWRRLLATVAASGAAYGLVMGSLGARWLGGLYCALKVPLLLTFSVAVCLPNFFVVNALLGLREDFGAAVRGILSAQGTLAVALAALAPVTALFYASGMSYPVALLWNGAAFLFAAAAAQASLARHYAPLTARRPRHRRALAAWFVLYAFVTIKVGWVLRPFVGDPALATSFLRAERWRDNPYTTLVWTAVGLAATIARKLAGD